MDEKTFRRNMRYAKHTGGDFAAGYQRGLRRLYHGEIFGTTEEHEKYMSLGANGDHRTELGDGYRAGFSGEDFNPPLSGEMKTTVIITKRGEGYISSIQGRFGGGHTGARAGLTPFDTAATAARYMIEYAQSNPEGGILMAPPEVMEHVPEHLRSVPAKS